MILDMGIGECLCSFIHERKKGGTWIRLGYLNLIYTTTWVTIPINKASCTKPGIQGVTPTTPLLKGAEKPQI